MIKQISYKHKTKKDVGLYQLCHVVVSAHTVRTYLLNFVCGCSKHSPEVGQCHSNWQHVNSNMIHSIKQNILEVLWLSLANSVAFLSHGEDTNFPISAAILYYGLHYWKKFHTYKFYNL